MASHLSIPFIAREKAKSFSDFGKALLFIVIGCVVGLLYAVIMYGFTGPDLFLGAGTGVFVCLSYYMIELHWLKEQKGTDLKQFIKGVILYTPVLTVAIFILLLMNDIAMALEDYGDLLDVPFSLWILPYTLLFAFFAAFLFQAGKLWWGKK